MIAVICGATGLVGSLLIRKLLSDSQFEKVISISRRSTGLKNSKLQEILIADLAEISGHAKDLRGDVYFCCLGTTIKDAGSQENFIKVDFAAVQSFAQIAKEAQAKSFNLISASGANSKSKIFYSRIKGQTEEMILKMNFSRLVIFRPAMLIGKRKTFRRAERVLVPVLKAISKIIPESLERSILTESDRLADAMLFESLVPVSGNDIIEAKHI